MDSQMKKGIVEMCLLQVIARADSYGYELIREMAAVFPELPERTVYTILHRLRENGYTETFLRDVSAGPPRKYCRITDSGRRYLGDCIGGWKALANAVAAIGIE